MSTRGKPRRIPSTTATTDCDSGDSEGIDYVYDGHRNVEKRTANATSSRRKKSSAAKPRSTIKCMCGGVQVDVTVFAGPAHAPNCVLDCDERGSYQAEMRKRTADKKVPRAQTPYIEEYPDEAPRPAILLKEHRVPRRFSTSDARRTRNSDDRSWSSGSRGRSPTGKGLPSRVPRRGSRRFSKESAEHSGQPKRRVTHHGGKKMLDNSTYLLNG